jgi:predicted glutamine amidotransferase
MSQPFNGDGFGVGWYAPEIDPEPCVMKAAVPAWSNANAKSLSTKIRSANVFAHIRGASPGMASSRELPSVLHGPFLFMHNGSVSRSRLRRRLQQGLSDRAFERSGTTDSSTFAVFLDAVGDRRRGRLPTSAEQAHDRAAYGLAGVDRRLTLPQLRRDRRGSTRRDRYAVGEKAASLYSAGARYVVDGEDGDMFENRSHVRRRDGASGR